MINTSNILNLLSYDEALEQKKLEKALKLTKKKDRLKLEIAIKALEKLNIISTDELGSVKLEEENSTLQAKIRCSSKGYCFAVPEDGTDDIYIRDHYLNHAWHGDSVLVKITKEAERRKSPEGIVQCILHRNTKSLISIIREKDKRLIATPLDDRLIEDIYLDDSDRTYLNNEVNENIVEVEISSYPIAQHPAIGRVVRELSLNKGQSGDIDILLTKSHLQSVSKPPKVTFKDLSKTNRLDLTHQQVLLLRTTDKSKSPISPAIYAEQSEFGSRLWIHIHAISERFTIGGKLDDWLKNRAASICLGSSWRYLHDKELIDIATFVPGQVNEAVSLSLDLDYEGCIKDWQFCLSRIKPAAIITQPQIEAISNRKPKARTIPQTLKPIKEYINQVQTILFISEKINSQYLNSIELDIPTPKMSSLKEMYWDFSSNNYSGWKQPLDKKDPQSILNILIKTSNRIWFIHSNAYNIATIITESNSLDNNSLNEAIKAAIALNIELELDDNGYISPNNFIKAIKNHDYSRIFYKIIKQIIKEDNIKYSNQIENANADLEPQDHIFNIKYQSPFCNPANSYLDIINQHLLVLMLTDGKSKEKSRSKNFINLGHMGSWNDLIWPLFSSTLSNQISHLLSKDLIELLRIKIHNVDTLHSNIIAMAKSREASLLIGKEVEGIITGVQSYGFFCEIPPLMIEGLVHVSTLNDDWYEYRSRQNLLIGRKNKKTYQLGDKVILTILKVDLLRNQIDLVVNDVKKEDNTNEGNISSTLIPVKIS